MNNQEDVYAMSEKELLAEILLELRQNTYAVENLRDETGDLCLTVKELAWDRTGW